MHRTKKRNAAWRDNSWPTAAPCRTHNSTNSSRPSGPCIAWRLVPPRSSKKTCAAGHGTKLRKSRRRRHRYSKTTRLRPPPIYSRYAPPCHGHAALVSGRSIKAICFFKQKKFLNLVVWQLCACHLPWLLIEAHWFCAAPGAPTAQLV